MIISKRLKIGVIAVATLLLAAAAGWGLVWKYANQQTVPKDVIAGDIALGGMPIDEAIELLEKYEQALLQRTITIQANTEVEDSKRWTVSELGYKAEFVDIRASLLKLAEGTVWDRAVYRYYFHKTYNLSQSWQRDVFETAVRKQWGWIEKNEAKDATRIITEDDQVLYEAHADAYRLDVTELSLKVNEWVVLKKGQIGSAVEQAFAAELPVTAIHPHITLEQLKNEGIDRKIIEFSTDFLTSAEGRAYNVTVTAEALNDWHLAPGEVFDYGKLIARAEELYDYQEAPVILNGRLVPGIGGGICQVSSTLYNAALRAGLDIVERRNHSLPVAYLPIGQDATYAGGAINFRFKNTTGKHLIIRTVVENRRLTVKLFGTMDRDTSYDIESVTVQTLAPKVQETVNASLPAGKTITVENGKPGYVVETYRTFLKNGEAISREKLSRDTYKAQPKVIERGTWPGDGSATPTPTPQPTDSVIEDGI